MTTTPPSTTRDALPAQLDDPRRATSEARRVVEVSAEEASAIADEIDEAAENLPIELTLNNLQNTHVLVENFDEGLTDKVKEDSKYLLELARLEAVAAERREWVAQERARRRRRLASYERSRRTTLDAIGGGDVAAGPMVIEGAVPGDRRTRAATGAPAGVIEAVRATEPDDDESDGPGGTTGFWL